MKNAYDTNYYGKSVLKTVSIILFNISLSTLLYIIKFTKISVIDGFIQSMLSISLVIAVTMLLILHKVKSVSAIEKKHWISRLELISYTPSLIIAILIIINMLD